MTIAATVLVRWSSLASTAAWLRRYRRFTCLASPVDPERAARLVEIVAGRLGRQGCLTKAFVLAALLQRRRIEAMVCIGACRDADGFFAHAWLRCGERVLLAGGCERFSPLCTIGAEVSA